MSPSQIADDTLFPSKSHAATCCTLQRGLLLHPWGYPSFSCPGVVCNKPQSQRVQPPTSCTRHTSTGHQLGKLFLSCLLSAPHLTQRFIPFARVEYNSASQNTSCGLEPQLQLACCTAGFTLAATPPPAHKVHLLLFGSHLFFCSPCINVGQGPERKCRS